MSISKHAIKTVSVGAALGLGLTLAVIPAANAATGGTLPEKNGEGQCLIDTKTSKVRHAEQSHMEDRTVPGKAAVTEPQEVWGRDVDGQEEVWVQLTQYFRTYEVPTHIEYDQWSYKRWVEGQKEQSHYLYQYSRTNPGHSQTFTDYYKYKQVIPAQDGVKTFQWKISVDDYKVKYQYQKQVSGVVQMKDPYGNWKNIDTFGWEWYSSPSYQWSFDDKDVLESGGHNSTQSTWEENGVKYRKVTQAYQYAKNGVTEQVKTGSHWEYQWSTVSPGNGWQQTGEWKWQTEPKPEQTILYQDGAWVKDNPGAPWTQYDHKSEGNNDAVAPFQEWRAQDGSATPNQGEAGKFKDESFDGWNRFGEPEKVVTQEETESKWVYLTRDADGNLVETDDRTKAAFFTEEDAPVGPEYTEFGRTTETKEGEPVVKTVYLTGVEGDLKETENREDASWLNVKYEVPEIWDTIKDAQGNPVLYEELVSGEVPGYTEYYLPGGDPTRELNESNWFNAEKTDRPSSEDGWYLLNKREFELEKAVPETVQQVKVVDKDEWVESKQVGVYAACGLAQTGGEGWGPAGLAGLGLVLGGVALVAHQTRKARRLAAEQSGMIA